MIAQLFEKFHREYGVTEAQFDSLAKILTVKKIAKGNYILRQGQIDNQVKYVISGIVHQYIVVEEKTFTIDISLSDMYFNCYKSYMEESPSNEIQVAVTDCQILSLAKSDVESLLRNEHWFCYLYLKSVERVHLERENRSFILQHKDIQKRFSLFMELNENADRYHQEVKDKLLAKYLAMTPESFSKAKKKYFLNQ